MFINIAPSTISGAFHMRFGSGERKFLLSLFFCGMVAGWQISGLAQGADKKSGFQTQEVKFDGAGVKLAGTMLTPKLDAGKRAAAVLIVGDTIASGRDGINIGSASHGIYKSIAEHLVSRGLVVLRYDSRCKGTSECKPADVFDDYVDDAHGAFNYLKTQSQVDPAQVLIFGHGEGGIIAATVTAQEESKTAGLVLAATPGRYLGKWLRDKTQKQMIEAGKSSADISAYLQKFDRVTRGITSGQSDFSQIKLDEKDPYDAVLQDLIKRQRIVVSLLINDPLQIAASVKAPVLILQGAKDLEVGVKDGQFLDESLKRVYNTDVKLAIIDNMDHLLKTNTAEASFASYSNASRPLDPVFLKVLSDWVASKVKP
jgi:alpha-beta hydrolase superfamily lysophospholipase